MSAKYQRWSEDDKRLLAELSPRLTCRTIAVRLGRPVARVWAKADYLGIRFRRPGKPSGATTIQRWAAKVRLPTEPGGCWGWTGATTDVGYGALGVEGRNVYAHRYSFERFIGLIPERMQLDHFRMNPGPRHAPCSRACVNPAHLEPVTQRTNLLRGTGPSARHAAQTHCVHGHLLGGDNLQVTARGWRICLTCRKQNNDRSNGLRRKEAPT